MLRKAQWKISSGLIHNPGKGVFLKLTADTILDVNQQQDENGTYALKTMIMTGIFFNTNELWHVTQLTPELLTIEMENKRF